MNMKRPALSAASPHSRCYFLTVRCHQWSDHPFLPLDTQRRRDISRDSRAHTPQMTVARFLRLDFVTFMFCELLFIAGAGDGRLKRTSRLHANVTDVRRQRSNQFEPDTPPCPSPHPNPHPRIRVDIKSVV